jgi:hypothetical protein
VARRESIEGALRAWRDAERRLAAGEDGDVETLKSDVVRYRDEFQRLSAELHEAEARRADAIPSTPSFHIAARDTQEIAAEIWEAARSSDEDTPETDANKRKTPRAIRPGTK